MIPSNKVPKLLFCLILWRLISVFVVQTAHVPDEYWQSLEVAHRLAFGYGYLTWEWSIGIRSYIYPFLISLLYRLLALFQLDYATVLTTAPRVFQALLTAYADYRFYTWTRNKWALFSLCINWYWYYCATRTLLNTLETVLTTIAISLFPWPNSRSQNNKFLWIVALMCAMRPTAAIVWTPLCFYHFCTTSQNIVNLALEYVLTGGTVLLFSTLVDTLCYGKFVVTPWEFLHANVINNMGDFYGKEHAFWYLTSGMPVVLGLQCITFLVAAWQIIKWPIFQHQQAIILTTIAWTICIYSSLAHKEFRFILPLLPMFIHLSTSVISRMNFRTSQFRKKLLMVILIASNLLPGFYFCLIHQRGTLDVMKILQNEAEVNSRDMDVLFLTPCHATPMYSHLHINTTIRFLTCEPNIKNIYLYMDEAEMFFNKPMFWLTQNYILNRDASAPSHLVLFDTLVPSIMEYLKDYRPLAKVFHTHFPETNYGQYIIVYKRNLLDW